MVVLYGNARIFIIVIISGSKWMSTNAMRAIFFIPWYHFNEPNVCMCHFYDKSAARIDEIFLIKWTLLRCKWKWRSSFDVKTNSPKLFSLSFSFFWNLLSFIWIVHYVLNEWIRINSTSIDVDIWQNENRHSFQVKNDKFDAKLIGSFDRKKMLNHLPLSNLMKSFLIVNLFDFSQVRSAIFSN